MTTNHSALPLSKGLFVHAIALHSNQPAGRFYAGGARISAFRGEAPSPAMTPEDWVGSTTSVRDDSPSGLTRLPSGEMLAAAVDRDPVAWLGEAHVERFGADTKLLVKLLDAGQRLPVHAHPDNAFAHEHLGAHHGKAEAWYILSPGAVFLGLTRPVTPEELSEMVSYQQTEKLLSLTHTVDVEPHDTVFVPPGLLHAIGEGVLLTEVQEPEDLSILLEWKDFALDGPISGHLGLGFDVALTAVEHDGRTREEVEALVRRGVTSGPALVPSSAEFFRLERVTTEARIEAGFAVVIVLDGAVTLTESSGAAQRFDTGSTVLVPAAAGPFTLTGGSALVARPPLAS